MRGFPKFVKHFADYFSARLRCRVVLPVIHRASYYAAFSAYRQALASHFFGYRAPLNWQSRASLGLLMAFLKTVFARDA